MGYTGTNCEEEILICADNPCQNNALCLMEEGVPTCYCVPDYHGEKCEYQYDECQLGPRCMNGGVCIDGVDTFSCSCPPLLTGMLCECLMIGEDSLDCNYTAPSTSAPITYKPRPTTEMITPKIITPTEASGVITKSQEDIDDGENKEVTGEEEEEESVEKPGSVSVTFPIDHSIFTSTISTPSQSTSESEEEEDDRRFTGYTTEPSISYDMDSKGSSETPYVSGGSGSDDLDESDVVTTVSRFDTSYSIEYTTPRPKYTSHGIDDYSSVTRFEGSTPVSGESAGPSIEDQTGIYIHPTRPVYTHTVTTLDTTYTVEYTTPRPVYGKPTYYPTFEIPHITTKPETDSHISPATEAASSPEDHSEEPEITVPHFTGGPHITTTAAPFFTEYPELVVTTKYVDVIKSSGTMTTTSRPGLTPSYAVTTISSPTYDYDSVEHTTPGISVTVHVPENHTFSQFTPTTLPTILYYPKTTYISKMPEYDTTPYQTDIGLTTKHPLYTDDLESHHIPTTAGVPQYSLPDLPTPTMTMPPPPPSLTPTEFKTSITYVPPTFSQPTFRPTVPTPMPTYTIPFTEAPQTSAPPIYSTPAKPLFSTIPPPPLTPIYTTVSPPPLTPLYTTIPPPPLTPLYTTIPPPPLTPIYTTPAVQTYGTPAPPIYTTALPPIYSTKTPIVSKVTTTESSSEEEESANTVATGLGPAAGGAAGGSGAGAEGEPHADCIKHGCYNGGTCVTTSEGSRVS